MVRTLVTGGAGFIGSNLVRHLLTSGHAVRVLDDFSTGLESNLEGLDVEVVAGSILDESTVAYCTKGMDAIVHFAARGSVARSVLDPLGTHSVNAVGTLNMLEASRQHDCYFILASSSSVYGSNPQLPKSEADWTQPISPYGASKLSAEANTLAYQAVFGLDSIAFRFFNVYGPYQRPDHDYAAVIPKFAWSALTNAPLTVHGDGEQSRDFTHVEVVIRVIETAIRKRLTHNRPINLALGETISVNAVVVELARLLGRELRIVHESPRPGDVRHSQNDPTLLRTLFPEVSGVPFDDGLQSVLGWLQIRI